MVVDLKTGKYAPTGQSSRPHPQLGLYQLAVDNGAARRRWSPDAAAGGAELVQLRHEASEAQGAAQGRSSRTTTGRRPIEAQLMTAVDRCATSASPPGRAPLPATAPSARSARPKTPGRCCHDRCRASASSRPPTCARGDAHALAVSDQQWAAITAPLEPAVVIAGAGSGKTTLMAARVVWLVAHRPGPARPGARPHVHDQGRRPAGRRDPRGAAARPASCPSARAAPDDRGARSSSRTVATYNAYAAALLTEHGLRIGHEPDTRVIADASRYQLAARVVDRHAGQVELLTDQPAARHRLPRSRSTAR